MENDCVTCGAVDQYVSLANGFTQDVSEALLGPLYAIFLAIVGLWIVFTGFKIMTGRDTIESLFPQIFYVFISASLLSGQGAPLVNQIFKASLSTMSGAASTVLSVGPIHRETNLEYFDRELNYKPPPPSPQVQNLEGLSKLVLVAEEGVGKVFEVATGIAKEASITKITPLLYAILMVVPYAVLLIVYFSQVVVSIFRVLMFATLSPIFMLGFGFPWGRGVAVAGVRTLFATFMVLFGATAALAICLYGVYSLGIHEIKPGTVDSDKLNFTSQQIWVVILMGWLGTAFMTEATGMANSIAGSLLSNTSAGVITAGVTGAAGTALTFGRAGLQRGGGLFVDLAGAVFPNRADSGVPTPLSPGAQRQLDRFRAADNPYRKNEDLYGVGGSHVRTGSSGGTGTPGKGGTS